MQHGSPGGVAASVVQRTVEEMQGLARSPDPSARGRLATDFREFERRCPTVYKKACEPMSDTDRGILAMMLEQMRAVEGGDVEHFDSSVAVGERLFDQYVRPIVERQRATGRDCRPD